MEECKIGRVYYWKNERLEGVGLEGCRIGRVKDWKSVRLEDCERDCINVYFHKMFFFLKKHPYDASAYF